MHILVKIVTVTLGEKGYLRLKQGEKMKDFAEIFKNVINETDSYKTPDKLLKILYNKKEREELFEYLLQTCTEDLSFDWFHDYFQEQHAERKKNKQDFTPRQISDITSQLTFKEHNNTYYESAVGSGGMAISYWNIHENEKPYFILEEMSDRTIPFLLFNLLIRGMNATILHADSLNRTCKGVFFVQNRDGKFSNLNLLSYTEDIEKEFNIKFTEDRYKEIKEDYNFELEQLLWLKQFDRAFNNCITHKIEIVERESDNKTVREVVKEYDKVVITQKNKGIIGIYPEKFSEDVLDKKVLEIVEIKGIIKPVIRIQISEV